MKPKLAICISGQPRGLPLSVNLIRDYLIKPNRADYDIDVFYHAWFDSDMIGTPYESAQPGQANTVGIVHPDTEELLLTTLEPTSHIVEYPHRFSFADDFKQAGSAVQRNLAAMFYSMHIANQLRRRHEQSNGFEYDVVLRIRYDLWFYNIPVLFKEYQDSVDRGFVCTSRKFQDERENPGFYGGYTLTDIFAFGNSTVMDDFSSTYVNFAMMNTVIWPPYGEGYLGHHTKVIHNHPVKTFDLKYDILHRIVDINTLEVT